MATRFNPATVKNLRGLKGYTLRKFGDEIGYSSAQVAQVEAGKTQPSLAYLYAIVDKFNIDIASIWK